MQILRIALDIPLQHLFDYRPPENAALPPTPGLRVRVPFGRGEKIGIVVAVDDRSDLPPEQLKAALEFLEDAPLPADLLRLCAFASTYYQAPLGELLLRALPPALQKPRATQRRASKIVRASSRADSAPPLTDEQATAVATVLGASATGGGGYAPFLLFGVTGSGKTEVYLCLIAAMLAAGRQCLLLTPEINLTPQLEARIRGRFPEAGVVMLHSDLAEAARERAWRAAASGAARIVAGTRLAVFAPLPDLGLIVVDEEHDPSYKQQEGTRHSARDLAVFRARDLGIPVVLGSATPSLESWARAREARRGGYSLLTLEKRAATAARLPAIRLVDTRNAKLEDGFSAPLLAALGARLAAGEQSLVFLNRRGYAPVLACPACGWVSRCPRCAANLVVHLQDKRLRCHHCGLERHVPRACPDCGNQDIHPFGRGTQRLEAALAARFPETRLLRVDRDAVKSRRQWEAVLKQIHAGEADILVGTQMLAKGHDFPRLTLVGVVGADAALFAADFRAPERLFAQLMQVAGRAGRADLPGEVLIQTEHPEHALYRALARHDYPGYAAALLKERREAGFPPYTYQAMLRAEAPQMEAALAFLKATVTAAEAVGMPADITLYDPVPMRLARLKNRERAQLLIESASRPRLQAFLPHWRAALESLKLPTRLRWHLEVDPLEF
ncbi:MAG: primosomal protein N' [Zoogloeaceae bacterium]|jgi:primosomal protein N' (replication factor Y)|nr:primosomal protein N' [Zoogloeaceae bacterium]